MMDVHLSADCDSILNLAKPRGWSVIEGKLDHLVSNLTFDDFSAEAEIAHE